MTFPRFPNPKEKFPTPTTRGEPWEPRTNGNRTMIKIPKCFFLYNQGPMLQIVLVLTLAVLEFRPNRTFAVQLTEDLCLSRIGSTWSWQANNVRFPEFCWHFAYYLLWKDGDVQPDLLLWRVGRRCCIVIYGIYSCISRPFTTKKSAQKTALDLYTSRTHRPDKAVQEINITIVWSSFTKPVLIVVEFLSFRHILRQQKSVK